MNQFDNLSIEELTQKRSRIDELINLKKAQVQNDLLNEFQEKARKLGIDFDELLNQAPKRKSRIKVPPKYQNPGEASDTWTGRGRKPKWLQAALDQGKDLEDFKIVK